MSALRKKLDETTCRLCGEPIFRCDPWDEHTEDADSWTTEFDVLAGGVCPAGGSDYACHEPMPAEYGVDRA